jgi:hypothetical protein
MKGESEKKTSMFEKKADACSGFYSTQQWQK